jgi:putative restriction endonuclease
MAVGRPARTHKPLLLLYALGRLQRSGKSAVSFREASDPVRNLLREFSPTGPALHPDYPFFYLQNDGLWQLDPPVVVRPDRSLSAGQLRAAHAIGSLPEDFAEALRRDPMLFGAVVRHLLNNNEPSLHEDICAMAGLDIESLELGPAAARVRDPAFRDAILAGYEYRCAVCGYEGQVKGQPVGLEAAHVRWWASGGPDVVANALCLCSLHHKLLDSGVLGLTEDYRLLVSMYFVARSDVGQRTVLDLAGRNLLDPQRGQPRVLVDHIGWHTTQVFSLIRKAIRPARVVVLPQPGPATIASGPSEAAMAFNCAGEKLPVVTRVRLRQRTSSTLATARIGRAWLGGGVSPT